jgi:exosortase H (IPTLxxWG-CTERM-specific)
MNRFIFWFFAILLSSFFVYLTPFGKQYISDPITSMVAYLSSIVMQVFDPTVRSEGINIFDTASAWGVQVVAGCNGMEAVIILLAAVFAFPSTFTQKLAGFIAGFVAIHALNVVRIISLFYIGKHSKLWFDWFHLYVWQALIIIDALVVWLLWLRWINKQRRAGNTPPSGDQGDAPAAASA